MEYRKIVYAESYEKNGEKKTLWHECGVLFINKEKNSFSIKLTSIPLSGNMMAFPPKPKEEARPTPQSELRTDDLPWEN